MSHPRRVATARPLTRRGLTRRSAIALGAAGLALPFLPRFAEAQTLAPDAGSDQTAALTNALAEATRAGRPLVLQPGRYTVSTVELPDGALLGGVPGRTQIVGTGRAPALAARGARTLTLGGLAVEGGGVAGRDGLVVLEGCERLAVEDCAFIGSAGHGLRLEGCGGAVRTSRFENHGQAGLFSRDATGLAITDNTVEACGDNGVLVWRSAEGEDGTLVSRNRIATIEARSGGTGQNGNAVNLFRAGGVIVADNQIRDCAFSAVRNNSSPNGRIAGNVCRGLGEVAIYAEFAFDGAIVEGNLVDGCGIGISITNFIDGGRLAVCSGNIVRNIRATSPTINAGVGIAVEADAALTGNVIEGAPRTGIQMGWGPYLRDVAATGNVLRDCATGVTVSTAPGAGAGVLTGNLLSNCTRPLVGAAWDEVTHPDLAREAPAHISLSGNRIV